MTEYSHFKAADISELDKDRRVQLINSIVGYKSVNLIGTADLHGQTNLAVVSSVCHLGSNPPLLSMVIRPASAPRHTLSNILATRCYTINHVSEKMLYQAHQTSARYPKKTSEFDATGLSPIYREDFTAPFVEQSPLQIGMSLCEVHHLDCNNTELVIGQVHSLTLRSEALSDDGFIDLNALQTVCASGIDAYHLPSLLTRLPYAKPQ